MDNSETNKKQRMAQMANDLVGRIDYWVDYKHQEIDLDYNSTAENLVNAGYGNLVDFADFIKYHSALAFNRDIHEQVCEQIDEALKHIDIMPCNSSLATVLSVIDKEMANLKTGETNSENEGDHESAVQYQVRYWELHRLKEKIQTVLKDKPLGEIVIDGKYYSINQLQRYIKFYDEHQIKVGQTCCPLCGSEYAENGLFICDCCGNLLNKDERCKEHNWDGDRDVCKECCTLCQHERAFEDAVNQKVDIMRGK